MIRFTECDLKGYALFWRTGPITHRLSDLNPTAAESLCRAGTFPKFRTWKSWPGTTCSEGRDRRRTKVMQMVFQKNNRKGAKTQGKLRASAPWRFSFIQTFVL
jgi:hypothetical protein